MNRISRRSALVGVAGLASLAASRAQASAPAASIPDFSDPLVALRTHVKLVGSLAKETVYSFMRLNIYADTGEGNFVPLFTLNNILVDHWTPKGDDQYEMRKYEVGFYSRHGSHEILEHFDNPITGKREAIHQFLLGPVPRVYTPDGVIAMGFTPKALPIEVIGDRVFLATESIESRPDMVHPGKTTYVNSFMTMSAPLQDVLNPAVTSAPSHLQLQNKTRWAPWMGMGERAGGTVVRGFGGKIASLEALPKPVYAGAKKLVPKIFETATWNEFLFEDSEFLKQRS